jgi:hypothetical protein
VADSYGKEASGLSCPYAWAAKRLDGQAAKRRHGTMADAPENGSGKPRRRPAAKAAARPAAAKVKATIHLSVEASQRLSVHAAMMGMDRSELVEALIGQHLRRFVVSDRGGADAAASGGAAA